MVNNEGACSINIVMFRHLRLPWSIDGLSYMASCVDLAGIGVLACLKPISQVKSHQAGPCDGTDPVRLGHQPMMSGSRSTQSLALRLHNAAQGLHHPIECIHGTAVVPFYSPCASKPIISVICLHVWRMLVIQPPT